MPSIDYMTPQFPAKFPCEPYLRVENAGISGCTVRVHEISFCATMCFHVCSQCILRPLPFLAGYMHRVFDKRVVSLYHRRGLDRLQPIYFGDRLQEGVPEVSSLFTWLGLRFH